MLNRLTIVIPTYERQDLVVRAVNFWANKGPKLLVLDGSAKAIPRETLSKYKSNLQYFHSPVGLYRRLANATELIKTDFVVLACDDEFFIPSALAACIEKLDLNPDLIACCGRSLGFSFSDGEVYGRSQYPLLADYELTLKNPEERLIHHMSNYVPSLIYAVTRKNYWIKALQSITSHEFPVFAIYELQLEMMMSFAGKSIVLPLLMWLRSHGEANKIRCTSPSLDPERSIPLWWSGKHNEVERGEFLLCMSESFKSFSVEKDTFDFKLAATKGVEAYLGWVFNKEKARHSSKSTLLKICSSLKLRFNSATPILIKRLIRLIIFGDSSSRTTLMNLSRALSNSGVQVDFSALEEIRNSITKFHKAKNM
jgi:glycosyltransferase domain-containing protein